VWDISVMRSGYRNLADPLEKYPQPTPTYCTNPPSSSPRLRHRCCAILEGVAEGRGAGQQLRSTPLIAHLSLLDLRAYRAFPFF
jgi:hypothetical protein